VLASHEAHAATVEAVGGRRLGLAGHAWFESMSVLTRMPPGIRRSPREVAAILRHDFPATRFLDAADAASLSEELGEIGIAGGSAYDALVGAAARAHGLPLITRDRRALATYAALGAEVELLR
jgi:predicted nucleic acid-binding protein